MIRLLPSTLRLKGGSKFGSLNSYAAVDTTIFYEEFCYNEFTGSKELILDSFACSAAQKFGLLKKSE